MGIYIIILLYIKNIYLNIILKYYHKFNLPKLEIYINNKMLDIGKIKLFSFYFHKSFEFKFHWPLDSFLSFQKS